MVKWNDLCNESEAFKSNLNFELRDQKHFFESKGFKACRNIVEINFHFANPIVVNKKNFCSQYRVCRQRMSMVEDFSSYAKQEKSYAKL